MPTLELTDDQVLRLIEQLPPEKQRSVYQQLVSKDWEQWIASAEGAQASVRELAQARGLDWDALDDAQRLSFIDDLVHDDDGMRS
jgi:hypothetical protein